jgi:hypothetical protein
MTRHVPPANRVATGPGAGLSGTVVTAEDAFAGRFPDAGLIVVVENPRPGLVDRLVAAHDGADNLVVAVAGNDLSRGQVGALAGVGAGWAATPEAIRGVLLHGPTGEMELRWLLWNDGAVVIGVPGQAPTIDVPAPWIVDRVPHPSIRPRDLREATVPTITFLVHGGADLAALASMPDSAQRPSEVVVVDAQGVPDDGRIRCVPDVAGGLESARGAIIMFVHADVRPDREAFARVLRRFDDERVEVSQVVYRTKGGPARSARGLALVDAAHDAPVFAAARRRVLRKERDLPVSELWARAVSREPGALVVTPSVVVAIDAPAAPLPTTASLAGMNLREVRALVRERRRRPVAVDATSGSSRPTVGWIGFHGHDNFGDELVLRAGRQLLEGLEVLPGQEGTVGTVLGGGTLLNAKGYYQRIADRIDAPGLRRLVLGTGVVSPDVGGWTEDLAGWAPFLEAGPVGVRGPRSVQHLRDWGYRGPVEVLGDPALALTPPAVPRGEGVLLAPVGRSSVGQVDPDAEVHQLELLIEATRRWRAEGRDVSILSAHRGDDRVAIALMRSLGETLDVVHAYDDLDGGVQAIAASGIVVATRLHALVLAAAVGAPFIGLAYRSKVHDVAESIGASTVRDLDAWTVDGLLAAVSVAESDEHMQQVATLVDQLRERLHQRTRDYVRVATAS